MTLFDHLLAVLLVVVMPLRSGVMFDRLRRADPARLPARRLESYGYAIALTGLTTLAALSIGWLRHRPASDLGLEPKLGSGLVGVMVGLATIGAVMRRERRRALADSEGRAEIRARLESTRLLLPHTRGEFTGFVAVAITAGVCEELLYRGYLTWYFAHALPWWGAGLLSAVAFGLGHAYQGMRGVATTTLVGVFLSAVCFVSGSLYAAMLIHALMDLHTGHLAWRVYEREGEDEDGSSEAAPGAGTAAWTETEGPGRVS